MEMLKLAAGIVAVRDDRLVIVCSITRTGAISVRDLVSGETSIASASELSLPRTAARDREAVQNDAALTKSSARQWQRAIRREACVIAVLTRPETAQQNIAAIARNHQTTARTIQR